MVKLYIYSLAFIFTITNLYASEFKNPHLLHLSKEMAPYAFIVEKSSHSLHVFKNNDSTPELVKSFKIATGLKAGLKKVEGDKKTPEGIYTILKSLSREKLQSMYGENAKIYGAGAFTLNYPNAIDRIHKRYGSGIWIHSTDDDSRIDKGLDSRGCVVATDADFSEIQQYITLEKTPVVIVQDLVYYPKKKWKKLKANLKSFFDNWAQAWSNKDLEAYIDHYSKEFYDARKGSYLGYKKYKRRIFKKTDSPLIVFSNPVITYHNNYAIIKSIQDYKSQFINDVGVKELILKLNDSYEWKIIRENWKPYRENINE